MTKKIEIEECHSTCKCHAASSGQRAGRSSRGRHGCPTMCLQAPKLTAQQGAVQYNEVLKELCCSPWVHTPGAHCAPGSAAALTASPSQKQPVCASPFGSSIVMAATENMYRSYFQRSISISADSDAAEPHGTWCHHWLPPSSAHTQTPASFWPAEAAQPEAVTNHTDLSLWLKANRLESRSTQRTEVLSKTSSGSVT